MNKDKKNLIDLVNNLKERLNIFEEMIVLGEKEENGEIISDEEVMELGLRLVTNMIKEKRLAEKL